MAKLEIKYRLEGKALPPQPIRVSLPGWGGSPAVKKENGSQPQPWHCPLFVAGCTQGVELLYQYETPCHIVNDGGRVRIEWDRDREPGTSPNDFTLSAPAPSTEYLFATGIDLQPPPGYVLRTETHPRYFNDQTHTVPAAFYGHVQSEWWPKKLFVVFKIPAPGQRHVFRKGEPYAQVLFIPQDDYVVTPMTPEEADRRRSLEADIKLCKSLVAKNVWNSGGGIEFNDHYKVLERVYAQGGLTAVEALVRDGVAKHRAAVPTGESVPSYLGRAQAAQEEGRYVVAKELLHHVLKLAPRSAQAYAQMATLEWDQNVTAGATSSMRCAISLQPNLPNYRLCLADMFRRLGRLEDAQREIELALARWPTDPQLIASLGFTMAQRGQVDEGLERVRAAAAMDPLAAVPHFIMGRMLEQAGRRDEARAAFETALRLDPNFAPARASLSTLDAPAGDGTVTL